MRVLVTGASGMLGSAIVKRWAERHDVYATGGHALSAPWRYRAFDLAQPDHAPLIAWAQPELIVHCAAWTAVDACERDPERALDINGRSVERLLAAAPDARMIYISTDAVFGDRTAPLVETDAPGPINAYGRSKLVGESFVGERGVIVRTTVVGWNIDPHKQSFIEWIVRSLEKSERITLFTDTLFNPMAATLFADELEHLVTARGCWHIGGHDAQSKYDFGVALCDQLHLDRGLIAEGRIADARFAARRSADQRLSVASYERAFGRRLPTCAETIAALVRDRTGT